MDACLSVIAQAFIDACSISDLQLGKVRIRPRSVHLCLSVLAEVCSIYQQHIVVILFVVWQSQIIISGSDFQNHLGSCQDVHVSVTQRKNNENLTCVCVCILDPLDIKVSFRSFWTQSNPAVGGTFDVFVTLLDMISQHRWCFSICTSRLYQICAWATYTQIQ